MPKEIDDFSVCGETWYGICELHGIIEQLEQTKLWLEAGGSVDQELFTTIYEARGRALSLKRHLIDLQIKLLTVL